VDKACRWVIKYFSCLLGNAVPKYDIIVTSAAIRQWRRHLSACVQAAVDILDIIFSHVLSRPVE